MNRPDFYRSLIKRYKDKTATDAELEVFMQLTREGKLDEYLTEDIDYESAITDEQTHFQEVGVRGTVIRWLPRVAAAASVLVIFSVGLYLYYHTTRDEKVQVSSLSDIPPGGNKAILTLSDGTKINLNAVANGQIAQQTGIVIRKAADGQLVYEVTNKGSLQGSISFNTISTPYGGQYKVLLPDGTSVWLNAASSLQYPTRFTGNSRQVTLIGEGYFEVAKDRGKPFTVKTDKQTVKVLGTHFNVNAYGDEEAVVTTLLEGSVQVVPDAAFRPLTLKPGQQMLLTDATPTIKSVDTEETIDWKNGDFIFADEDIKSIMRRIARWYDVEVIYQNGTVPDASFTAQVSRNKNVSEVLQVLELTGAVHFRIEGRKITVIP